MNRAKELEEIIGTTIVQMKGTPDDSMIYIPQINES